MSKDQEVAEDIGEDGINDADSDAECRRGESLHLWESACRGDRPADPAAFPDECAAAEPAKTPVVSVVVAADAAAVATNNADDDGNDDDDKGDAVVHAGG